MSDIATKREQLLDLMRSFPSCAVAFSAGVDSTVVAKAAALTLGDRAVAVTGVSPSLADGELEAARRMARLIGIRHLEIDTDEMSQPQYAENSPDRCYHCKTELYRQIKDLQQHLQVDVIVNGANADDLFDYRPGMRAASEQQVRSPLAESGLTKSDVRALAKEWELPIWDKPATPCLSSRIAYGEQVTVERLAMIDRAEQFLRQRGFATVRVRYHTGDLARIEVPLAELPRLLHEELRSQVAEYLQQLGFQFVTLDVMGFRSGSLNVLVPLEQLHPH
ncbi:MAG: ATP-dependent sacrificial sulfur transferase LarE [Pirellulaceae bacterium]